MGDEELDISLKDMEIKLRNLSNALKKGAIDKSLINKMNLPSVNLPSLCPAPSPASLCTEDDFEEDDINVAQAYAYKHLHVLTERLLLAACEDNSEDAFDKLKIITKVAKIFDDKRVNAGINIINVKKVVED